MYVHLDMIEAGSGSIELDLIVPNLVNLKTSSFVSDLKDRSFVSQLKHCAVLEIVRNSLALPPPTAISLRIRSIFCMKKSANAQARSVSLLVVG